MTAKKKEFFSFSFLLLDAVCKEILSDYLQSVNLKYNDDLSRV